MRSSLMLAGMLLVCAGAAQAEFNYNYVSLSYGNVDIDDLNVDGDGLGAEVSLGVGEDFYLIGRLEASDLDSSVDLTQWRSRRRLSRNLVTGDGCSGAGDLREDRARYAAR